MHSESESHQNGRRLPDHPETATILAKYSKLELDTLRSMARSPMSVSLDLNEMQPQLDVALKYGVLPRYGNAADMNAK